MNCKPGDLAIIVCSDPYYNGRIVEVLSAPPEGYFTLPDGQLAKQRGTAAWVIKFVGGTARVPVSDGTTHQTWYVVCADAALRPLRGDPDAVDETTEDELTIHE